MRKLFTILSAVAITIGLGVPAGAATRSSDKKSGPGHAKPQHGDKDRDRHVKDGDHDRHVKDGDHDRKVKDRDHDGDHDRRVKHGDHDGDRDDRHFNDRDRDRDRRDFSGHHDHYYHYYHYYYYYPYYGGDYYYDGYRHDRYYYDRYSYGRYYGGRRYYDGGYRGCDDSRPPDGIVVIRCLAFNPPHIHVGIGQDVVWWWQDGTTPHTVTADDGSFDSGRRTDGNVRLTFNHQGEFTYHCRIHPEMTGSVLVG